MSGPEDHRPQRRWRSATVLLILAIVIGGSGCNLFVNSVSALVPTILSNPTTSPAQASGGGTLTVPTLAGTTPPPSQAQPSLTPTPTLVAPTIIVSQAPSATAFNDPPGCQKPPDDYGKLAVNGYVINARTLAMLKHAQELYGGKLNFTSYGIAQGSYTGGAVTASFGTHDGGGAVDLSVVDPRTGKIMTSDLEPAIHALRVAGFAAWVRLPSELYPGSPVHIHAIAIGDAQLSQPAKDQLTGEFGYFRGYDGLPQNNHIPIPDRYGGPILCKWMFDMGYRILSTPTKQP